MRHSPTAGSRQLRPLPLLLSSGCGISPGGSPDLDETGLLTKPDKDTDYFRVIPTTASPGLLLIKRPGRESAGSFY